MNASQKQSLMTSVGIVLAAVFSVLVAVGKVTPEQSSILQNSILTVLGAGVTVGLAVWKLFSHSDENKVVEADALPGVSVSVKEKVASPAIVATALLPTNDIKVVP